CPRLVWQFRRQWLGRMPSPKRKAKPRRRHFAPRSRDLFGVDQSVVATLPDDVPGEGYLNSLSALQAEQYLAIANIMLERVLGPAKGPPPALQQKLFGEHPASGDERAAAAKVARDLARRAYRRPAQDEEIETLLKVFDLAQANKQSYMASLRLMLKAVL